jgi:hypothetical protein
MKVISSLEKPKRTGSSPIPLGFFCNTTRGDNYGLHALLASCAFLDLAAFVRVVPSPRAVKSITDADYGSISINALSLRLSLHKLTV